MTNGSFMTDNKQPYEPVLPQVPPVPGGLYGDAAYEAVLGDIQLTVAKLSAALVDADEATASRLTTRRRELNRLQTQLRPDDGDAVAQAHTLCRQVLDEMSGGGR
ncbi:hypothetical protein [Streptomyces sp. NPDC057939]|uniref:hypothetical protein n=1 Tax=Streptomyces sp. NPDC057939 TaxID=3346284 RepID=UPI0036E0B817